jgi:hypothetical protein
MEHPLKLPSPTKLARLGHFPPASLAGRLAGPVFHTTYLFSGYDLSIYLIIKDPNSNLFLLQVRLREAENEDTIRKLREKLEEVEEERRREREQQPAAPVASLQASCS